MLQIKDLSRIYKTEEVETTALDKVDIEVQQNEFVAIMGPSGCGKSTLLNILGMLDYPDHGSYQFLGQEVGRMHENKRAEIRKENLGFVFQNYNLIETLTVFENVELPLLFFKYSSKERKKMVLDVLARMKLGHRAKHFPTQLSGGQQQRVAIARAIISNPKLLLADEPTGNLDSKNGQEIMKLLTQLNQEGTTIIMVTHSERDANYAHRIIQLFDGKTVIETHHESI